MGGNKVISFCILLPCMNDWRATQFCHLPKTQKLFTHSLLWRQISLVNAFPRLFLTSHSLATFNCVVCDFNLFLNCIWKLHLCYKNKSTTHKQKKNCFFFFDIFWLAQTVHCASFHACLNLKLSLRSILFPRGRKFYWTIYAISFRSQKTCKYFFPISSLKLNFLVYTFHRQTGERDFMNEMKFLENKCWVKEKHNIVKWEIRVHA